MIFLAIQNKKPFFFLIKSMYLLNRYLWVDSSNLHIFKNFELVTLTQETKLGLSNKGQLIPTLATGYERIR